MLPALSRALRREMRGSLPRCLAAATARAAVRLPAARMTVTTLAEPQMLCYQCEQTSSGKGCMTQGVCSKTPVIAGLQDLQMLFNLRLGQLAHLAGSAGPSQTAVRHTILTTTFATLTNVNFDDAYFDRTIRETAALVAELEALLGDKAPPPLPGLPASLPSDRKSLLLLSKPAGLLARGAIVNDEDLFGVLEMGVYGMKGLMAYFTHAEELLAGDSAYSEAEREEVYLEIYRIFAYLAEAGTTPSGGAPALDKALGECLAVGALNLKVIKMLDAAHRSRFGVPAPTEVPTTPGGARPAILVSGHDLGVLHDLLEQTKDKNVDVYTHGEMLPAHGYPKLHAFEHLRGHFGTHWGNQLHEFRHFPGAILMTSNCLRPPTRKYKERIWTAGPVGFPALPHINGNDYGPLIEKAMSLPCFDSAANAEALRTTGTQPKKLTVGFGHEAVLGVADTVVGAIKAGALKHVFVIGGCDGTEGSRSYFTDLAASTPPDSLILTLGCGKFRLLDTDHGTIGGLPRLLDMGQCNDSYSAIVVAVKLAEALNCTVHDLPLHFAVSWFEQKAVAVLLTLLHLNLKNIRIGPAVPAFLTPSVVSVLGEKFGLKGVDCDHEDDDLASMLEGR